MRKFKTFILFIAFLSFCIIPKVNADDSKFYDYVLSGYDVNIIVNENNSFDITEKIDAYFLTPKHGIYRKIPLKNVVTRLDGTKSRNIAKISNIYVSDKYSLSTDNGYRVIKIGDANYTLTGHKNYVISYLYNIGKDPSKKYDELYFNIIGGEWDTTVSDITFTITMPKEFDKTKIGFSSGKIGSTDSSNIEYNVNGNVIKGKYNGTLNENEALTIRLELPEGYFTNTESNTSNWVILMFIIPIIGAIISFLLWYKYGKDDKVIETVEFYPPEKFNSLEVGFLYKGKSQKEDVISLLIYLANKGYIKISEVEDKSFFSKGDNFVITKLKDYDGDNENEKLFLKGLFKKGKNVEFSEVEGIMNDAKDRGEKIGYFDAVKLAGEEENTSVTKKELYNNFYITLNKILSNMNSKENKKTIFEQNSWIRHLVIIIFIFLSFIILLAVPSLSYGNMDDFWSIFGTFLVYLPFYAVAIFAPMEKYVAKFIMLLFIIIHSFFFIYQTTFFMAITNDFLLMMGALCSISAIILMIIFLKLMPKRNKYGNEMLGKIQGFKNFLNVSEKEELEALVMKDPEYFYEILPFTYALGVSNKWIKKFESISMKAPDWYDGYSSFDMNSFGSFMSSTMTSASSSMSSSSSSSSGGGSSGGGSGGGGGGSW